MCQAEGLAIAPFRSIGGGHFQTKAQIEQRKKDGEVLRWGSNRAHRGGDEDERRFRESRERTRRAR